MNGEMGRKHRMKRVAGVTSVVLSGMMLLCGAANLGAGQKEFEIELKELRRPPAAETGTPKDGFEIDLKELRPAGAGKPSHRRKRNNAPTAAEAAGSEGTSSYLVKKGDFLSLILKREYGLSDAAVERLVPEVMRLNAIRSPRGLTVGQRLTIPLPPPGAPHTAVARTSPQPHPATAGPAPSAKPGASPAPVERQAEISAAPPCTLARAVAEQLGFVAATPIKHRPNGSAFTAGSADLRLVVACGLTAAEVYTHTRLVALQHAQLLAFTSDEPPARVIQELADRLGLSFRLADPANGDALPLSYIFPDHGPDGGDLRLTIRPAEPTAPASPPATTASSTRQ